MTRRRQQSQAITEARAHQTLYLDAEEREQFEQLLARVIPSMMRGPGATRWLCRLCDMQACGRDAAALRIAEKVPDSIVLPEENRFLKTAL